MSLLTNIDHLARAPGVISIHVDEAGRQAHRGDHHHEAMRLAMLLRGELNAVDLNIVAERLTVVVERVGDQTAAVVVETGHKIRKSLRRMIRRFAKPPREPSGKARAEALEQHRDDVADRRSF